MAQKIGVIQGDENWEPSAEELADADPKGGIVATNHKVEAVLLCTDQSASYKSLVYHIDKMNTDVMFEAKGRNTLTEAFLNRMPLIRFYAGLPCSARMVTEALAFEREEDNKREKSNV